MTSCCSTTRHENAARSVTEVLLAGMRKQSTGALGHPPPRNASQEGPSESAGPPSLRLTSAPVTSHDAGRESTTSSAPSTALFLGSKTLQPSGSNNGATGPKPTVSSSGSGTVSRTGSDQSPSLTSFTDYTIFQTGPAAPVGGASPGHVPQLADQGADGDAVDVEDVLRQVELHDLVNGVGALRPQLDVPLVEPHEALQRHRIAEPRDDRLPAFRRPSTSYARRLDQTASAIVCVRTARSAGVWRVRPGS